MEHHWAYSDSYPWFRRQNNYRPRCKTNSIVEGNNGSESTRSSNSPAWKPSQSIDIVPCTTRSANRIHANVDIWALNTTEVSNCRHCWYACSSACRLRGRVQYPGYCTSRTEAIRVSDYPPAGAVGILHLPGGDTDVSLLPGREDLPA